MKERTRNLAVGLTVIFALLMLGGMILLFTGLPEMFQHGREIRMIFPATADAHAGDWVHLAGMRVGKITDISFVDGDPGKGVQFTARIDEGVNVPADVQPRVYTRGFTGGAYLELAPGGPDRFDPRTGRKLKFLPENWDQPLRGELKGTGLIPDEVLVAVRGLAKVAENLNNLISPPQPTTSAATSPASSQPSSRPAGGALRSTLAKLAATLDAVRDVLGDPENQANIKKSMANLALATTKAADAMDALKDFAAQASKAAAEVKKTVASTHQTVTEAGKAAKKFAKLADNADRRVQELSAKLIEDAERLSAVLASINRLTTKMESGEGTAGQLVNDPKLYQSLLEASQQLTELMKELRALAEHWRKHGVPLKVK